MYFISKINIQCFDIVNELDNKHFVKLYSEVDGSKSPEEIITFLYNYLIQNEQEEIIVFADNCCGQNKNRFIMKFFYFIVNELNLLKSVRLKFLLQGHTHTFLLTGYLG